MDDFECDDFEGDDFEDPNGYDFSDQEECEEFADPTGRSALRAESATNPRNLPCPTCGEPNTLTPKDVRLHYQCNRCADRDERGGY